MSGRHFSEARQRHQQLRPVTDTPAFGVGLGITVAVAVTALLATLGASPVAFVFVATVLASPMLLVAWRRCQAVAVALTVGLALVAVATVALSLADPGTSTAQTCGSCSNGPVEPEPEPATLAVVADPRFTGWL